MNFDALRQLLGDNAVDESRETYEFRWVGKDAAKSEAARTIDKMMPRHVVFVLVYEDRCRLLLNYKEWADREKGTFNIIKTFCTSWQPSDSINLTIEGSTMDKIYESFAGQVSGFGTNNATDTRRIIAIENEIATKQKLAEVLQKKIRKEKQFARQVEMNTEARTLKREIGRLKEELKKIK